MRYHDWTQAQIDAAYKNVTDRDAVLRQIAKEFGSEKRHEVARGMDNRCESVAGAYRHSAELQYVEIALRDLRKDCNSPLPRL